MSLRQSQKLQEKILGEEEEIPLPVEIETENEREMTFLPRTKNIENAKNWNSNQEL
jgi:hypothetical protein